MTGGGIAGGLNHAIKQSPGAGWLSESDVILLQASRGIGLPGSVELKLNRFGIAAWGGHLPLISDKFWTLGRPGGCTATRLASVGNSRLSRDDALNQPSLPDRRLDEVGKQRMRTNGFDFSSG